MTGGQASQKRRGAWLWLWIALAVVAATGLAAGLAFAFLPSPLSQLLYDNRPSGVACEDLPERVEVEAALQEHAELERRIEAVGDRVNVFVAKPCESHPDRAEIEVQYPGGDDRQRIEDILKEEDFGVPVTLRNV